MQQPLLQCRYQTQHTALWWLPEQREGRGSKTENESWWIPNGTMKRTAVPEGSFLSLPCGATHPVSRGLGRGLHDLPEGHGPGRHGHHRGEVVPRERHREGQQPPEVRRAEGAGRRCVPPPCVQCPPDLMGGGGEATCTLKKSDAKKHEKTKTQTVAKIEKCIKKMSLRSPPT